MKKNYTQEEALTEIFTNIEKDNTLVVHKHRYNNNKLSQKAINKILENHGFKIVQACLYAKV